MNARLDAQRGVFGYSPSAEAVDPRLADRTALAGAHREIARLRNALRACRDQAGRIIEADGARAIPSPHVIRAEMIVSLADHGLKDAA